VFSCAFAGTSAYLGMGLRSDFKVFMERDQEHQAKFENQEISENMS
jgi:hypothetical protein